MRAESTKCRPSALDVLVGLRGDGHAPAVLAHALVLHVAVDYGEKRVVTPQADSSAGHDLRPSLPDEDRARVDELSTVNLHAKHLRVRVAAVARRATALLVSQ